MTLFLPLQQCLACLVDLTWIVLEIGSRWPYNYCFVGCCFQNLLNTAHKILVQLPSSFFSIRFVSVYVVHAWSRIYTTVAWKESRSILSDRLDLHMIDNLSIVVHAFAWCILMSVSVDETQLLRYVNLSINFRELLFSENSCSQSTEFGLTQLYVTHHYP